jgi:hypothetical protein
MPIKPIEPSETEGAFDVVHKTLSSRASARAFSLPRLSKAHPDALSVAMPHRVESLALGHLRRGTIPKNDKADFWRFLVLENREPIAAATAIIAEAKSRPIAASAARAEACRFGFGGLDEGPFVRGTAEAVRRAEDLMEVREGQFEAVLLVIPALYVVALWLQDLSSRAASGHSGEADLLIAIPPSNSMLDPGEPMRPASFLQALTLAR